MMTVDLLNVVAQPEILAASGDSIANALKGFVAPIAAVLVGAVGLKYLFGEEKSLAGFIGFLILGAFVYALIAFGNVILGSLGKVVSDMLK